MSKFLQFLEGTSFFVFLLGIFYVVRNIEAISLSYEIPLSMLWVLCIIGILYILYSYLNLYMKVSKLEYEFTSIVNHTFRTPLTRIMWFAKELEQDMPKKDRLLFLQNISNSTNKVLEIVDLFMGIKNISNTSSYFFEAISIRDVVEKSILKYREEIGKKNITFQASTFKDIPLLTLDIKKISFVVDAIIENAIFYSPKNSRIWIECIGYKKSLTLIVSDSGMGLSFVDKLKIFTRFYRNKRAVLMYPDGMGLKLYLSKQIIKRHKGSLYAKSEGVDKGTKFFMELPYS
ncbi:MAG: HAMP domain-containing histidine kinase [bacterium]|nr:HAMP domain-containing histidine kinase [bacterium]